MTYILPGYVHYTQDDGAIFVCSALHETKVKLSDAEIRAEFQQLVAEEGCNELNTPMRRFLNEQGLLTTREEVARDLSELNAMLENTLMLTIMPTEGCNFRCAYCYESHTALTISRRQLDWIQEFIAEQAPKFKNVNIQWFGGEPSLCKDVVLETNELVQMLQKKHGFYFSSGMTTNGYLLTPECLKDYLSAGITAFQITLDGRTHDQTRPHVSGKGTMQTILDNLCAISALPQEEYPFQILLRHNILVADVDKEWYNRLKKMFGDDPRFSVIVQPVGDWGGESVKALNLLPEAAMEVQVKQHVHYLKQIGMQTENGSNRPLSRVCIASYPHGFVIRGNGDILKCTVCLNDPQTIVGYVDPVEGVKIDEEKNARWSCGALHEQCFSCKDVLACLNRHCPIGRVVSGADVPVCRGHFGHR